LPLQIAMALALVPTKGEPQGAPLRLNQRNRWLGTGVLGACDRIVVEIKKAANTRTYLFTTLGRRFVVIALIILAIRAHGRAEPRPHRDSDLHLVCPGACR